MRLGEMRIGEMRLGKMLPNRLMWLWQSARYVTQCHLMLRCKFSSVNCSLSTQLMTWQ